MSLNKRLLRLFQFALISVLFLNILHTSFFFQRAFKPFEVSYTVTAPFDTFVWHSVKSKYQKDTYKTETVPIPKNKPTRIEVTIDEPQGLHFLGLFWSMAHRGTFSVSDAKVISESKEYTYQEASQIVGYSSSNLDTQISEESISAVSESQGNGWFMLDTLEFENLAKKKVFTPFGWKVNGILFALVFLLGFFLKHPKKHLNRYLIQGSTYNKLRGYTLFLWMFLLPFWNQASHVFLGITVALFIWGLLTKKVELQKQHWRLCVGLWLFFLSLFCIDLLFHIETLGKDFENYIYFILAPFVFLGIPKPILRQLMRVLQFAVFLFVTILVISVTERYLQFSASESFEWVFFNITNGYWHTSYLAGFIVVAHLFALKNDESLVWSVVLIPFTLYFFYITEARLPAIAFTIIGAFILLSRIQSRKRRNLIIGFSTIATLAFSIYLSTHDEVREQLVTRYFPAKTDMMDARPALWSAGYGLIQEHTFTGIGRMNIRSALTKAIPQETKLKYRNYNMHNQYLEWWLGYGVFVLIAFVLLLVYPLRRMAPNYLWFFGYIVIVLCVESYFARQAGVVFFSIWYCYFLIYDHTNPRIHKERD